LEGMGKQFSSARDFAMGIPAIRHTADFCVSGACIGSAADCEGRDAEMDYAAAGGSGANRIEQLHRHDGDLHSGVLWMGIRNVRKAAVLPVVLCGGRALGGEFGGEYRVAEIFPVWAVRVDLEVADVLEGAADAAGAKGNSGRRSAGRNIARK